MATQQTHKPWQQKIVIPEGTESAGSKSDLIYCNLCRELSPLFHQPWFLQEKTAPEEMLALVFSLQMYYILKYVVLKKLGPPMIFLSEILFLAFFLVSVCPKCNLFCIFFVNELLTGQEPLWCSWQVWLHCKDYLLTGNFSKWLLHNRK